MNAENVFLSQITMSVDKHMCMSDMYEEHVKNQLRGIVIVKSMGAITNNDHIQGGLHTEVRLGDDMMISPFKLSTNECGLIRLQIEFVLDRWVTHTIIKCLIIKRSPKISFHLCIVMLKVSSIN